jgi:two-component system chemotaxis response regulator CheY
MTLGDGAVLNRIPPAIFSDQRCWMPRLLIADDSAVTRRALRNLFEGNGWEVCGEAEDGLAAVEKTAILKPDLVILDFSMPKLNGLQAGHTIHTADPHIPLLLFTLERIGRDLEEQARRAGFRGALAKGEGIFALSQAIEELLQGRTFFLTASAKMSPAELRNDSEGATDEAKKKLKPLREPTAQDTSNPPEQSPRQ